MTDLIERLRARSFRLATRDMNGDGARLALEAAALIIEQAPAQWEREICEWLRTQARDGDPFQLPEDSSLGLPLDYAASLIERGEHREGK